MTGLLRRHLSVSFVIGGQDPPGELVKELYSQFGEKCGSCLSSFGSGRYILTLRTAESFAKMLSLGGFVFKERLIGVKPLDSKERVLLVHNVPFEMDNSEYQA